MVVYFLDDHVNPPRWRFGIIAPDNDTVLKTFDFPGISGTLGPGFYTQLINWTIDGKALTYIDTKDGVSNIWAQPVDGGQKKQLTHFKSDLIFKYAWSHDGKLALARGSKTSEVMLIMDIGKQH
jgi:hypothetical protein